MLPRPLQRRIDSGNGHGHGHGHGNENPLYGSSSVTTITNAPIVLCLLLCLVLPHASLPELEFFKKKPESALVIRSDELHSGQEYSFKTTKQNEHEAVAVADLQPQRQGRGHRPRVVYQTDLHLHGQASQGHKHSHEPLPTTLRGAVNLNTHMNVDVDVNVEVNATSWRPAEETSPDFQHAKEDIPELEVEVEEQEQDQTQPSEEPQEACDPKQVDLSQYPQWADETGYWVGQYDFYQENGTPHESKEWNYPYSNYRGFITGNAIGTTYRQRNVFLYRPQDEQKCAVNSNVWGDGECGMNGNVKLFEADQSVTTCSTNPALAGDITGTFGDHFFTTTELVGHQSNNAVLYQVWFKAGSFGISPHKDLLFQSQLTTITRGAISSGSGDSGEEPQPQVYRTRSAQEFEVFDGTRRGQPVRVSYYREQKTSKPEFYKLLQETMEEFNILQSDICTWKNGPVGNVIPSDYQVGGMESCAAHLEQSFQL